MTEETIIDGELSCNNCLEKTRCKQQQEVKEQRIGAILSYIANEDNEKYIAELKNEIPAITRCDVVLEKQLKRLEQERDELKQENEELKENIEAFKTMATVPTRMYNECERERCKFGRALLEIRELIEPLKSYDLVEKAIDKINEVLE